MQRLHNEEYFLNTLELDRRGRMPLAILVRLIQQSAEANATELGFGVEDLLRENLTWMLLRLRIRLADNGIPEGRQMLRVETWPSGYDARFAYREFSFFAESTGEEPFARVWSDWLMVNLESGRPVRLEERFTARHIHERGRSGIEPFPVIKTVKEPLVSIDFPVRHSDIDVNGHVNNMHYVYWIREAVPEEIRECGSIVSLDAEYRTAAAYGDIVHAVCYPLGGEEAAFMHILQGEKGQVYFRSLSRWKV